MVFKFDRERVKREYGIDCLRIFPVADRPTPFGSTWCEVEPRGSTSPHHHADGETFFIFQGHGTMVVEDRTWVVGPGDAVYLPAFSQHLLTNTSESEKIVFLSVWWDRAIEAIPKLPKRALVTAAPPTPNGDVHLGHLSGPYLASDTFARGLRKFGVDVVWLAGSDDNQSYVLAKAMQLGRSPDSVARDFSDSIRNTFVDAGMQVDAFLAPLRDEGYTRFVQTWFSKLVEDGKIEWKERAELYCEACDRVLYEAFVSGGCPHCGAATSGHGCEGCGVINQAVDLKDPKCRPCGAEPTRRIRGSYVFPLSQYGEVLAEYYSKVGMSTRHRTYTHRLIQQGLEDFQASFHATWGMRVHGREDHAINVWIEMAGAYLYFAETRKQNDIWAPYTEEGGAEVYQFFGFDNSYFNTALIPAVMLAANPDTKLPARFFTNEFYTLDGSKFSTSRNHAVWAPEALAEISSDAIRVYLAATRPEVGQTDFTWREFLAFTDSVLIGQWESWVAEVDAAVQEHLRGRSPEVSLQDVACLAFYEEWKRGLVAVERAYQPESFSMTDVFQALQDLVRRGQRFSSQRRFLKESSAIKSAIGVELLALKSFAIAAEPLIPKTAGRILHSLGLTAGAPWESLPTAIEAGIEISSFRSHTFSDDRRMILKKLEGAGAS